MNTDIRSCKSLFAHASEMRTKKLEHNSEKTPAVYNKITQGVTLFVNEVKSLYNRAIIKLDYAFTKCTKFISNQFNKTLHTIKKICNYCSHSPEFKMILVRMLLMITMYTIYYLILGGYHGY
jgi:hypothetical protein